MGGSGQSNKRGGEGLAVWAVVCGVAGVFCFLPWFAAIVLGHMARGRLRGTGSSGYGIAATVGLALGYLGIGVTGVSVAVALMRFGEPGDPLTEAFTTATARTHASDASAGPRPLQLEGQFLYANVDATASEGAHGVATAPVERALPYELEEAAGKDVATLEACALGEGAAYARASCFVQLAALDRAAALSLRRAHPLPESATAEEREVSALLERFPDLASLYAELRSLGLIGADATPPEASPKPVTVLHVLSRHGRYAGFDAETGSWPNRNDALLAELAGLTAGALDGVVFDELINGVSSKDLKDVVEAPLTLAAHMDGKRYALPSPDLGDWYDVDGVLGLLNTLLRARASDQRCTALATEDQYAHIACGPAEGLTRAATSGLIASGNGSRARELGKAAEQRALEMLKRRHE